METGAHFLPHGHEYLTVSSFSLISCLVKAVKTDRYKQKTKVNSVIIGY